MIILKILAYTLLFIITIIAILLITPIGASVKHKDGNSNIYVHVGLIRLNLKWFTSKKHKKAKKQSLKKHIKKQKAREKKQGRKNKSKDTSKASLLSCQENNKPAQTVVLPEATNQNSHIFKTVEKCKAEQKRFETSKDTGIKECASGAKEPQQKRDDSHKSFFGELADSFKNAFPSDILDLVLKTLKDIKQPFAKHTKVKIKRLQIRIASDDAAKTAFLYGVASMVYEDIFKVCKKFPVFRVKEKNCGVLYDFSKDKTYADMNIKLTLTPIGIVIAAIKVFKNLCDFK